MSSLFEGIYGADIFAAVDELYQKTSVVRKRDGRSMLEEIIGRITPVYLADILEKSSHSGLINSDKKTNSVVQNEQ